MPSLMATLGLNANPFARGLQQAQMDTARAARGIRGQWEAALQTGVAAPRNTLFFPRPPRNAVREYQQFWNEALTAQDIEGASRRNMARRMQAERRLVQQERFFRAQAQRISDSTVNPFEGLTPAPAKLGIFQRAIGGITNGLSIATKQFLGATVAIGAFWKSIQFIGGSIKMDIAMQRVSNTLKSVTGSAQLAEDELKFLREEAERVGFRFISVAQDYARWAAAAKAANVSTQESRMIFTALQEAVATLGLESQQAASAMLAIEQMMSKGIVMSQELRLQLGNALPGAVATFSKALGISQAELLKLVETGKLLSKDVLPKFAEQLRKDYKLTVDANPTFRDIQRLHTAWDNFKAATGKALRAPTIVGLEALTGELKAIQEAPKLPGRIGGEVVPFIFSQKFREMAQLNSEMQANIRNREKALELAKKERKEEEERLKLHPRILPMTDEEAIVSELVAGGMELSDATKKAKEQLAEMVKKAADLRAETIKIRENLDFEALSPKQQVAELQRQRAELEKTVAFWEKASTPGEVPGPEQERLDLQRSERSSLDRQIRDLEEVVLAPMNAQLAEMEKIAGQTSQGPRGTRSKTVAAQSAERELPALREQMRPHLDERARLLKQREQVAADIAKIEGSLNRDRTKAALELDASKNALAELDKKLANAINSLKPSADDIDPDERKRMLRALQARRKALEAGLAASESQFKGREVPPLVKDLRKDAREQLKDVKEQITFLAPKETKDRPMFDINERQRIGTFIGGPQLELQQLDVSRRSEMLLRRVETHLRTLVGRVPRSGARQGMEAF